MAPVRLENKGNGRQGQAGRQKTASRCDPLLGYTADLLSRRSVPQPGRDNQPTFIWQEANRFFWRLTNSGTDAAILTWVEVQARPSQQGKLKKVKLDGDTAADPADIPWNVNGAVVSVFTADVKHKQIVAGQTRTFTLEFEKDYTKDTTADYQVTITFAGGETLSWNLTP